MLLACRQAHSQSNILSRKVKAKMNSSLAALLFLLVQQISAQLPTLNSVGPSRAPSPAPSPAGTITASANTSGSLGNYCSNQAGLNQLVQATATNAQPAGLSVTIPSTLQDASSLQSIAQIAWQFIVTYQIPVVAKSVALITGNATAVNTFYLSNDHLANYNDTGGVTPNHDTLYNQAFLDLSQGPQIITVPIFDTPRRYWIVQLSDAYQNFFGAIGITYSSNGSYLVVGRGAQPGATYTGFTADRVITAPTDLVWVLGRVLVLNDSDLATAYNLSKSYCISPYNPAINGSLNASSKAAQVTRAVNGSGYGAFGNPSQYLDGLSSQNPAAWFNLSNTFAAIDPPVNGSDIEGTPQETTLLTGLVSNITNLASNAFGAAQVAAQFARTCVVSTNVGLITNTGWTYHPTAGRYTSASGTTYLLRAQDLRFIPTPLPTSEVIYYQTSRDSSGQILDASNGNTYTITFQLPLPAQVFWSLTIYNSTSLLLFRNPIERYNIGDRTPGLVYGNNNSTLQVYLASTAPANGIAQYANWLPAPSNAPFQFILRIYGPTPAAAAGNFAPPPVVKNAAPQSTAG